MTQANHPARHDFDARVRPALRNGGRAFAGERSPLETLRRVLTVVSLLAIGVPASAADRVYGTLPDGMLSTSEMTAVSAEICRDHCFEPAPVTRRLPSGYRLLTVEECAKDDPAVARFVAANARFARFAVGSLCFVSAGAFTVDGGRVHAAGATPMAFWWARAEGPRDSRMRGKAEWLQLASWYSRDVTDRATVVATDPMAEFTSIRVDEVSPGVWRLHLELQDETVDGEVRCTGSPTMRRGATEPRFMSVPFSGNHDRYFWVISYFGHHHRPAQGEWRSLGTGVFNAAFQVPDEAGAFGTLFQNGWSALSGLYERAAPKTSD